MSTPSSPHGSSGNNVPQESRTATPAPLDTAPAPAAALPPGPGTEAELAKARTDRATAEERSKAMEEQLKTVASELQALREQNDEAIGSREQLEKKLKEAEQVATAVKDVLQGIRQERSKDAVTIAAQDLEMQKLSEKLAEQTEILERERTLLAAGRDIHDLMGARNLHIADVFDVDSKGKDQKAFGRIFYTEEKSLIFYAFDLGDRNTAKRNASFQVWGTRGPAQNPTRSLGIFYVDDQKQNRWVLKFEDRTHSGGNRLGFCNDRTARRKCQAHGPQIPLRIPQRESQSSLNVRSVRTMEFFPRPESASSRRGKRMTVGTKRQFGRHTLL